jgi:hypothetical protein
MISQYFTGLDAAQKGPDGVFGFMRPAHALVTSGLSRLAEVLSDASINKYVEASINFRSDGVWL